MLTHTYNGSIWKSEADESFEFEVSLVCVVSLRPDGATVRPLKLKKKKRHLVFYMAN